MKPRNTRNTRNAKEFGKSLFRVLRVFRGSPYSKSGMTLIELIITLSILAAVASVALVTLSDMGATNRYDETERRGLAAQRAVIGQPGEISRFFNDLGRYPVVLTNNPDRVLAELYDLELTFVSRYSLKSLPPSFTNSLPSGVATASLLQAITNSTMGTGWRGPYLFNRNDTFKDYTDNWGRPWWVTSTNDYDATALTWVTNALLNDPIVGIMSEGEGSGGYLAENQVYAFYANSVFGNLYVTLDSISGCTNSVVFFYVPYCDPDETPELCEIAVSTNEVRYRVSGVDTNQAPEFTLAGAIAASLSSVTYSNVPVGIRKIWACAMGPTNKYVRPQTVEIKPGDQSITLYLNESF